jgi:hypothetical protein
MLGADVVVARAAALPRWRARALAWPEGVNGTSPNVSVLGSRRAPARPRPSPSRGEARDAAARRWRCPRRRGSAEQDVLGPTKSWRKRPASSRARMMTRRARSVNRSNTGSPPLSVPLEPVFASGRLVSELSISRRPRR